MIYIYGSIIAILAIPSYVFYFKVIKNYYETK